MMKLGAGLLAVVGGLSAARECAGQVLGLSVEKDGAFAVSLDGRPWLAGAETMVGGASAAQGDLVPVGMPAAGSGTDELGAFKSTTLKWAKKGEAKVLMEASFKQYPADPAVIVFTQHFPDELANEAVPVWEEREHQWDTSVYPPVKLEVKKPSAGLAAQTVFPGFSRNAAVQNCFQYDGTFPAMHACELSKYKETHMGGFPLVQYDSANGSLPMTVFSPLNQPMAHHMASGADWFGAGVKATVELIPAGWSQSFILSAGQGVNAGMMAWGDRILKFTGKPRANMWHDLTHSTIGFWTDNGGYYHYATGEPGCKAGDCPSYETVLPEVKAYHEKIGVPFRHWQFDSWFYPKDGGVNAGGGGGAVTNWTADPKIFPSGMVAIQEQLKLPIVMHNRQWSIRSDYEKTLCQRSCAGGKPMDKPCTWYNSTKAAVPTDPIAFFTWFFTQQDGWGLSMYEQDWMVTEYDEVQALQSNISMGDLWLEGMATGAASSDRTVQYCMPLPSEVMSAAAYPAVTNARATGDYFHGRGDGGRGQWALGGTSLFYWAIGILPFKDGYYSSTNKQVGGQTVGPETNPDREALMATLSCAMVGPMDGIHLLNKTRTMTSARGDGYILKPDRPLSTTDSCFKGAKPDPTCATYYTYSTHAAGKIGYVYMDDPETPLTADMFYLKGTEEAIVYDWYSGSVSKLAATNAVKPGYEGHVYAMVSPIVGGWAFVGEVDKYVTASKLRFPSVVSSAGKLTATVDVVTGETVKVCAAEASTMKLVCQSVSKAGNSTVTFPVGIDK